MQKKTPMRKTVKDEPANIAAIRIDYDRVLLMPVEDGLEFMRLISQAELMKGYNEPRTFEPYDETISFGLMSMQEYREKKMARVLEPEGEV